MRGFRESWNCALGDEGFVIASSSTSFIRSFITKPKMASREPPPAQLETKGQALLIYSTTTFKAKTWLPIPWKLESPQIQVVLLSENGQDRD